MQLKHFLTIFFNSFVGAHLKFMIFTGSSFHRFRRSAPQSGRIKVNRFLVARCVQSILRMAYLTMHTIPELRLYWKQKPKPNRFVLPAASFELAKSKFFNDTVVFVIMIVNYNNQLQGLCSTCHTVYLHYRGRSQHNGTEGGPRKS